MDGRANFLEENSPITKKPKNLYIGLSPFPVIVTTTIISCLVGDSYKPSFATITGDNPTYTPLRFNMETEQLMISKRYHPWPLKTPHVQ